MQEELRAQAVQAMEEGEGLGRSGPRFARPDEHGELQGIFFRAIQQRCDGVEARGVLLCPYSGGKEVHRSGECQQMQVTQHAAKVRGVERTGNNPQG